jgi:hypothetical protein
MNNEMRMDLADHGDAIAALRERVAAVEASLSTMMSLLSLGDSKTVNTIEASETVRRRRMRVS